MPSLAALFLVFGAVGAASTAEPSSAPSSPPIVHVEAHDGRSLLGHVDERTDADALWIRREEEGVVLTVAVTWRSIAAASVDGRSLSVDELQSRLDDLRSAAPPWFPADPLVANEAQQLPPVRLRPFSDARARRVQALHIVHACLVNLDHDAEPDGLRVAVSASARDGLPVAVRGSLTAQLHGQRQAARDGQARFDALDRWSRPVSPSDFIDGVATFELPFRRTAPEWDHALLPDAVITVQLGAHGEGNFAASAPVVVREFNPLRDNLQLHRGTRFVPGELHGRDPHSGPRTDEGYWLDWSF